jgi:hypothetical protein
VHVVGQAMVASPSSIELSRRGALCIQDNDRNLPAIPLCCIHTGSFLGLDRAHTVHKASQIPHTKLRQHEELYQTRQQQQDVLPCFLCEINLNLSQSTNLSHQPIKTISNQQSENKVRAELKKLKMSMDS